MGAVFFQDAWVAIGLFFFFNQRHLFLELAPFQIVLLYKKHVSKAIMKITSPEMWAEAVRGCSRMLVPGPRGWGHELGWLVKS